MKFLIECEGHIYGVFETDQTAVHFAFNHCQGRDWSLLHMHVVPLPHDSVGIGSQNAGGIG